MLNLALKNDLLSWSVLGPSDNYSHLLLDIPRVPWVSAYQALLLKQLCKKSIIKYHLKISEYLKGSVCGKSTRSGFIPDDLL